MSVYGKHGLSIRLIYLGFSICWWIITIGGRLGRNTCLILCYHGVAPHQKGLFEWQMKRIASRVLSVKKDLPQQRSFRYWSLPRVSVTFDDAFANQLENALPITRSLGVPAMIFAVVENLGTTPCWEMPVNHPERNEPIMTTDQIKSANQNNMCQFGSHTLTHPDLTRVSIPQIRKELFESKNILENLIGEKIEDLALPYGSYNKAVLRLAWDAGYKRVYVSMPVLNSKDASGGLIWRYGMSPEVWKIEFLLTCAGAYAWLHPWRRFIKWVRKCSTWFRGVK